MRCLLNVIEKFCRARLIDALENAVLLQGGVAIVQCQERHAEIEVGRSVVGLLPDRGLILLHCFRKTTLLVESITHLVVGLGVSGSQLNGLTQFGDCVCVALGIVVTPTEVVVGRRVVR